MRRCQTFRRLAIFVLGCCIAEMAVADVGPRQGSESIPELFNTAPLVVRGEVAAVRRIKTIDGEFNGRRTKVGVFNALVNVDRVYKGALSGESVPITFVRPEGTECTVSICETLSVGEYDLFFLAESDSSLRLLDKFFGRFPISRLGSEAEGSGIDRLRNDLIAGLLDTDESQSLANIELFGALEQVSSDEPLLRLLPSADILKRAAIYEALLRLHDYTMLPQTGEVFEKPDADARLRALQYRITYQISEVRSGAAVPALLLLSQSRSPVLRMSVIHALRHIADLQSAPVFIKALDDPEPLIRYDAVLGLATLQRDWDLAPSLEVFHQNEAKYIRAWKKWWTESGKAMYVTPSSPPQR